MLLIIMIGYKRDKVRNKEVVSIRLKMNQGLKKSISNSLPARTLWIVARKLARSVHPISSCGYEEIVECIGSRRNDFDLIKLRNYAYIGLLGISIKHTKCSGLFFQVYWEANSRGEFLAALH